MKSNRTRIVYRKSLDSPFGFSVLNLTVIPYNLKIEGNTDTKGGITDYTECLHGASVRERSASNQLTTSFHSF